MQDGIALSSACLLGGTAAVPCVRDDRETRSVGRDVEGQKRRNGNIFVNGTGSAFHWRRNARSLTS